MFKILAIDLAKSFILDYLTIARNLPATTGCGGILDNAYVTNTKGTSAILCSVTASMYPTRNSPERDHGKNNLLNFIHHIVARK